DKILLQQSAQGEIIPLIKKKAAEKEIPLQYVPVEKLNVLTGGNHQGVIAFIASIEFQSIENILPFIIERGEVPLLLILDGITDIRNFGAIARTAYASGVHAIIIPVNSAAPVNEDAIKTSAGALTKIPVCREKNLSAILDYLKLNGIQIIGTDSNGDKFVHETDLTLPTAIIMGAEDTGISSGARKFISENVKLPMQHNFDSYNVSVAAGMFLYEVMRQRI
ncbi:MAG: 23S rRNA (guanosine(2251)-2'-O)-methyltransferase RlmB, partial [Chitinophagales bacterium]